MSSIIDEGDIYTDSDGVEVVVLAYELPYMYYGDIGYVEYKYLNDSRERKTLEHFMSNFKVKKNNTMNSCNLEAGDATSLHKKICSKTDRHV